LAALELIALILVRAEVVREVRTFMEIIWIDLKLIDDDVFDRVPDRSGSECSVDVALPIG
jgi:hypothetical protein